MKFMMIFEGVDRASKVMNKIMAAEKKVAASAKAGAQASDRANSAAARTADKLASAYAKVSGGTRAAFSAVVSGAQAAGRATAALHRQTVLLAKAGIGQVGSGAGKVLRGFTLAAGVATAAFGTSALAAGHLLGTATAFESYNIQLETLEGSATKGRKAMEWITQFAVQTPLELDQVVESYRNLKTFGLDPTNGTLQALVDTMAASGKGTEQLEGLTLALGQAWTKGKLQGEEALQLLERGVPVWDVLSKKYGKNAAQLQEMASKGKLGREAITFLIEEMGRMNGGASEKMARTWDGMLSNISDVWGQFQLSIMNAGLFDWMKGKLQMVLDTINQMKANGTLDQWAKVISDRIIFVLDNAWKFATGVWQIMEKLGVYLQMAADYVGGWENLAMVLAGLAFAPALISTAAGIVQIAMGISMLSAALVANPIVLIIAAIVAGAAAIYMNWGPIKAFFIDLWNGISSAAAAAWNGVKSATTAAWEGVRSAVSNAVSAIPALVTEAWERIKTVFAWHPAVIIVQNWGAISGAAGDAIGRAFAAVDAVWSRMKALFDWSPIEAIKQAWAGVSDAVGGFIDDAAARASAAWNRVKSVFSFGGDGTATAPVMPDPVSVQAEADAAMAKLAALDAAAQKIVPSVTGAVRAAQTFLAGISFYDQGAALMDTMAAGMRARAFVVIQEIQKMAQAVRDHLPSSPAKVGPLSDIHRLKFGETIAQSIRAEPMVKAMRAASAATLAAAAIGAPQVAAASTGTDAARAQIANASAHTSGAGGVMLNFNPSVTVPPGAAGNPADIKAAVLQALRESAREMAAMMAEEQRRQGRKEF
ncbi:tape measure protein [Rhizobium cremeum]|uniref:tape measure protein n=1 Tax=Rhizobium cremeum TaxID=2813827 RepID=UPI001FD20190|nr:tape measure protein [Rhizobium cremeum]MCJ7996063.1 tape measure protein [Rhizobium cremeum]MCJ8001322.1 tape measure protein [Rhizobium cremeum]